MSKSEQRSRCRVGGAVSAVAAAVVAMAASAGAAASATARAAAAAVAAQHVTHGAVTNPLSGRRLYRIPDSPAVEAAAQVSTSHPAQAALLRRIAVQPTAVWYGDWTPTGEVRRDVSRLLSAAGTRNEVATIVAYDIPDRDCGGYSAGGARTPADYRQWIARFAAGLGQQTALVIVEPDALASADCLSPADQLTRYRLLRAAVRNLSADRKAEVYLDAGHAGWQRPAVMAARLRLAGVARVRGFSLDVSNFDSTATETAYARAISRRLEGSHAVIDTSRNGRGPAPDGAWCNPPGRGLGMTPRLTRAGLVDGYLWVKYPGESDGTCNGGPAAGTFWPAYAERLAHNAARRIS